MVLPSEASKIKLLIQYLFSRIRSHFLLRVYKDNASRH